MASSQTTNYGLNQWAAEDKVLREAFNQDNATIDAALWESHRLNLLFDASPASAVNTIVIDLRQIKLTDYCFLELWAPTLLTETSSSVAVRLNDIDDSVYYTKIYSSISDSSTTAITSFSTTQNEQGQYQSGGFIKINLFAHGLCGQVETQFSNYYSGEYRGINDKRMWGINPRYVSRETLTHLTINSSDLLLPGSRILLFGLRI